MKKRTKALIFLIFIVGAIGSSAWAWKTELVEDVLSTTEIPFHLFYKDEISSVKFLQASNTPKLESISTYKSSIKTIKNYKTLYDIDGLTSKSKTMLINDLEPSIKKGENSFLNSVKITGLYQGTQGWGPILTFSIMDDTTNVNNISYSSIKDEEGNIVLVDKLSNTISNSEYAELPDNFNVSLINKGEERASKSITGDSSILPKKLSLFKTNSVLNSINVDYNNEKINYTYKIGTDKGIRDYTLIQNINTGYFEK